MCELVCNWVLSMLRVCVGAERANGQVTVWLQFEECLLKYTFFFYILKVGIVLYDFEFFFDFGLIYSLSYKIYFVWDYGIGKGFEKPENNKETKKTRQIDLSA